MDAISEQDPSWSAFRPAAPVPLMFKDARAADPVPPCPPALIPDGSMGRQRLRLLGALGRIAQAEYEKALEAQTDALAAIICRAYREWVDSGRPPSAQ